MSALACFARVPGAAQRERLRTVRCRSTVLFVKPSTGGDCAASCSAVKAASRRLRRWPSASLDHLRATPRIGRRDRWIKLPQRGRTSHLLLVESIADGSVEPDQEFARHRNQDHLAWFAASAQTIAECSDLGIRSHRGAGRIEQNDLDAATAGGEATPSVRAPALVGARCKAAERGDFPAVEPPISGNSASSARAVACATPLRSHITISLKASC